MKELYFLRGILPIETVRYSLFFQLIMRNYQRSLASEFSPLWLSRISVFSSFPGRVPGYFAGTTGSSWQFLGVIRGSC